MFLLQRRLSSKSMRIMNKYYRNVLIILKKLKNQMKNSSKFVFITKNLDNAEMVMIVDIIITAVMIIIIHVQIEGDVVITIFIGLKDALSI